MKLLSTRTIDEALALRAETGARIFAGGTDIFPERATRRGWGDGRPETFIDLSQIKGLATIARDGGEWRIGCRVTWSDLTRAGLPPQFDGLRAAAREIGGVQIQNRGTLVGNICTASPAGDGAPCFAALEAQVELRSALSTRRVPFSDFITARRKTVCATDEIVTAILIPARELAVGAFRKLGARRYLVISIAMASAVIETSPTGRILRARIAVGACSETAQRLLTLEAAIAGEKLEPALADLVGEVHIHHLAPLDDMRSSAVYRREAAKQLARELLLDLATPRRAEAA